VYINTHAGTVLAGRNEMAIIKKGENIKGQKFAIESHNGKFYVHQLCANYAAHVHGGVSYTYRYIGKFLTMSDAEAMFSRRVGSKAGA